MFFKTQTRKNPDTGELSIYYRLVESYRNVLGEVRQRNIMSVGFMDDICTEELWAIADGLNALNENKILLFENSSKVQGYIDKYWAQLESEKKLDIVREIQAKESQRDWQTIDTDTIENKDIRELGGEWICQQTVARLGLEEYLRSKEFSEFEAQLAIAHIISRAVNPASEFKTVSILKESSSICELTGLKEDAITKDKLYGISKKLYGIKDGLEDFLSRKTTELFDFEDKIILYDLTNTYFEGEKRNSKKAKRGRSKEKRSDCPLLVLALVVNTAGFPKYSAIYEGNRGDSTTLCDMIDKLRLSTSSYSQKGVVVIDAGIATEDNLAAIVAKGYDYVCVNRTTFNTSHILEQKDSTYVEDNKGRKIELSEIKKDGQKDTEYYLRVKSPGKELKERSMNKQFVERFEEGLSVIVKGINSKGGTKSYDKVNQRIGRLKAKYPSVHRFYKINIEKNDKDICLSMNWEQVSPVVNEADENHGIYYIRTTLTGHGEDVVWDIYNCIREIESSFRCLKTDLDLRPVYHKSDKASEAHIHLALLAYSVVNTIRYQLKLSGLNYGWTEIRRQMSTHKIVTTTMLNNKGEYIGIRTCSKPNDKVKAIYQALKMKEAPFTRKKFVVLKSESEKKLNHHYQENTG